MLGEMLGEFRGKTTGTRVLPGDDYRYVKMEITWEQSGQLLGVDVFETGTIEVFERGAPVLDTGPAEAAARELALAEDRVALYGDPTGVGFLTSRKSPRTHAQDWKRPGQVLADLVKAVEILDTGGIPGPYEAVLPPARYYDYLRAVDENGYPTARQLRDVLAAVHRSPVMREAGAVFSTRGGDFVLSVGGDLATGYRLHDREAVHLFCVETVAPQTVTPEAVCLLEG